LPRWIRIIITCGTYCPTAGEFIFIQISHYFNNFAVFALIAALWGQVQYRALQLMPWLLMSRGYVPASQSVLPDYISPWSVISLITAARQKHFLVVLAISGAILTKLAIVFATGLFSISTVEVAYTAPFVLESSFNNSANIGDPANLSFLDPFRILSAYSVNQLNVTPRLGVNSNHAFPVFYDSNGANGTRPTH